LTEKVFWLIIDQEVTTEDEDAALGLDIGLTGHHNAGPGRLTPDLARLAARHPAWVSLATWTVDYRLYYL
jgi:hypothetical protein